jgi:transcription termination factor Rho
VSGIVDIADGHAFVRTSGYRRGPADVYVSAGQIRQYGLRKGDHIEGTARPNGTSPNGTGPNGTGRGKFNPLARVDTVNGMSPELARARPHFDDLTPLYPQERLRLEDGDASATARLIDLVAPIGKGQRGLIVSPPKAGKTLVLQAIATAIANSHPEVELMMVLVGERPEEVTDLRRSVRGEVIFSTFDQATEDHIRVAELAIERAKRRVELGADVVVLLDSITRLGRAYNLAAPAGSRPPPCSRRASSSAPRATWKTAARLPSCPPRSSTTDHGWTTCCSRSSRAPGTWSCGSAASWPRSASSRRST